MSKSIKENRIQLRNNIWPDADTVVWDRTKNHGFATVPRVVSLIGNWIKQESSKGDPSSAYFDLWLRAYDESMITVADENAFAFSAGYSGERAVRSWQERVMEIERLGFIRIAQSGNKKIGQILLLHPIEVMKKKRVEQQIKDEIWWNTFLHRCMEIGVDLNLGDFDSSQRIAV